MRLPVRAAATSSVAALLIAGLSACSGAATTVAQDSAAARGSAAAIPASAVAAGFAAGPTALSPKGIGNPFVDARAAAAHISMSAGVLAAGVAKAAKIKGGVGSDVSDLRSGLQYLLTEHVYLAGMAVATAYHAGAGSAEFKLAAATLEENSKAVAAAVGSIVPREEKSFLARWRGHVGDFVTYAVGARTGGAEGAKLEKVAVKNLMAYAEGEGRFFERISGGALPARRRRERPQDARRHPRRGRRRVRGRQAERLPQAQEGRRPHGRQPRGPRRGDRQGHRDGRQPDGAGGGPARGPHPSADLARLPPASPSSPPTPPPAAPTARRSGPPRAPSTPTRSRLRRPSAASRAPRTRRRPSHPGDVGDFVTYARGAATGDAKLKSIGLKNLEAYSVESGRFFQRITPGALPAEAVADDLRIHIETLVGAINSLKAALIKG